MQNNAKHFDVKSILGGKAGYAVIDPNGGEIEPRYASRTVAESVAQRWNEKQTKKNAK